MEENADRCLSQAGPGGSDKAPRMTLRKWSLSAVRIYIDDARRVCGTKGSASQQPQSQDAVAPSDEVPAAVENDARGLDSPEQSGSAPASAVPAAPGSSTPAAEYSSSDVRSDHAVPSAAIHYEGEPSWPQQDPERERDWSDLQGYLDNGEPVVGLVTGWNRGGLLVRCQSLQGFVPASQLRDVPRGEDPETREAQMARYVGAELAFRIMELDRSRNRLVLSERAMDWGVHDGDSVLASMKAGEIRRGRVSNICDFGAFVDLGGIDGLIHVSEIAWRRVAHPQEVLRFGQEVDVCVLSIDEERRRVALSLKRAHSNPWATVDERYRVGQIVDGTITNVVSFGAFARIEDGVEGLIHISELADENPVHPSRVVREGDVVKLRILRVDSQNHRLALSLRQASEYWSSAPNGEEQDGTVDSDG